MENEKLEQFKAYLEEMKEAKEDRSNTVGSHYGVTEKQEKETIAELVKDILLFDMKSEVLDKHFKKLDAEGRAKVHSYHNALNMLERMKK